MSITIKRSDFNVKNGITVTGFKLYRSAVSRAACAAETVPLVELDLDTHEYLDDDTVENQMYWYRIDADTEFGVAVGGIRAAMWSNVMGIATGNFIYGDYECGYMSVDDTKAVAFREAVEYHLISMMRQAGLIMSGTTTALLPAVYAAIVVDGKICFPPRGLMPVTSGGSFVTQDQFLRDILATDRIFSFEGSYYEIDVLKVGELQKLLNSPSVNMATTFTYPGVTTGFPVICENPATTGDADKHRTFQLGFDPALQRSKNTGTTSTYQCDFVARLIR